MVDLRLVFFIGVSQETHDSIFDALFSFLATLFLSILCEIVAAPVISSIAQCLVIVEPFFSIGVPALQISPMTVAIAIAVVLSDVCVVPIDTVVFTAVEQDILRFVIAVLAVSVDSFPVKVDLVSGPFIEICTVAPLV